MCCVVIGCCIVAVSVLVIGCCVSLLEAVVASADFMGRRRVCVADIAGRLASIWRCDQRSVLDPDLKLSGAYIKVDSYACSWTYMARRNETLILLLTQLTRCLNLFGFHTYDAAPITLSKSAVTMVAFSCCCSN